MGNKEKLMWKTTLPYIGGEFLRDNIEDYMNSYWVTLGLAAKSKSYCSFYTEDTLAIHYITGHTVEFIRTDNNTLEIAVSIELVELLNIEYYDKEVLELFNESKLVFEMYFNEWWAGEHNKNCINVLINKLLYYSLNILKDVHFEYEYNSDLGNHWFGLYNGIFDFTLDLKQLTFITNNTEKGEKELGKLLIDWREYFHSPLELLNLVFEADNRISAEDALPSYLQRLEGLLNSAKNRSRAD